MEGAEHCDDEEEHHHHRPEEDADAGCAGALHEEEGDENEDRQRLSQPGIVEERRNKAESFERRQHRDRRSDDGIAREQRRTGDTEEEHKSRAPPQRLLRQRHKR